MIEIKELSKQFAGRVVLNNIHLTFGRGKNYALIGESGSGKTTLLNMIAKLEPYDEGTIYYNGVDLKQWKTPVYYRENLGYLFQNFGLIENETIRANLELGFTGKHYSKQEKEQLKREVLQQVNLSHLTLEQKIYELSGGEAQRVALAKIILKNPPLILADEPTAALDPVNADEVMELLFSLQNDERTIIVATHNPLIWEKADSVIQLEKINSV